MTTVIIFGPTGQVASTAAITAHENGVSKVVLAMRNTSKPLLAPLEKLEKEKPSAFERVKADLSDADSIRDAVKQSGAKGAFIYQVHQAPNFMKDAIQAFKDSGIEHVVFLSSSSVEDTGADLNRYEKSDMIPFIHARTEIVLEEVYGTEGGFTALRPGFFTSNLAQSKMAIKYGDVKYLGMEGLVVDCIAPDDIGRVAGIILAEGNAANKTSPRVALFGGERINFKDAYTSVGKAVGKTDLKVSPLDEAEYYEYLQKVAHLPPPIADSIVKSYKGCIEILKGKTYAESKDNVKKITGREPTSLNEWLAANKDAFNA